MFLRTLLPGKCKYVFSINSGRSGSEYLAHILNTGRGVQSFHEPVPQMIGDYLRMTETIPMQHSYNQRRIKTDAILKSCKDQKCRLYIETNHMFIKTFYDVVCNELPDVKVIHIRRPLAETLKSFTSLGYFSDKNSFWPLWMSSPFSVNAAMKYNKENWDWIDLCIGYLIDIEARAVRFREEYPKIPVFTTTLMELNSKEHVKQLVDFIEHPYPTSVLTKVGTKVNERSARKEHFKINTEELNINVRVQDFIQRLKNDGIQVPMGLLI